MPVYDKAIDHLAKRRAAQLGFTNVHYWHGVLVGLVDHDRVPASLPWAIGMHELADPERPYRDLTPIEGWATDEWKALVAYVDWPRVLIQAEATHNDRAGLCAAREGQPDADHYADLDVCGPCIEHALLWERR